MLLRRTIARRIVVTALVSLLAHGAVAGADVVDQASEALAPGVTHRTVATGEAVAEVAEIDRRADVALQVVPAGGGVGALERTSALCRRVGCLAAVNGDFRLPGTRLPVGGVVRDGELLRSPSDRHHQLLIADDGSLEAGPVSLTARLLPTDLAEVSIDGVNVERGEDTLVLYTDAAGDSTGTNGFGVEVALTPVEPGGPVRLGQTTLVELGRVVEGAGDTPIRDGEAVLSGHGDGAARLRDLMARVESGEAARRVLLRVETVPEATESLGGTPVLIRDGRRWFAESSADFVRGRHPRTAVGWNDAGDVWLVVVDGRRPGHSTGMTLGELAEFMLDLGATDAINLDGGGTSTFTVAGDVVNRPSDQLVERSGVRRIAKVPAPGDVVLNDSVERPTVSALAVVPDDGSVPVDADPLAGENLDLVPDSVPPVSSDPASIPGAALPALVGAAPPRPAIPHTGLVALAIVALAVVALGLGKVSSRSPNRGRLS